MDLVLASTSPRRVHLMSSLGLEFRSVDPHVDEDSIRTADPTTTAMARAEAKALAASATHPGSMVVAADTVVDIEGDILDKAADEADVARMLAILSGRQHRVITAVAVCYPGIRDALVQVDVVNVSFKELDEEEIEAYAGTGEGVGKAGGYAFQGRGRWLVEGFEGDPETVIGLPTRLVAGMIEGI